MKVAGSDVHLHRNRQLFVSHPRLLKAMEGAYERENWHLPSKNNIKIWECCLFDSKNQKSRRNKRVPLTVYLNRIFFFLSMNVREETQIFFILFIYYAFVFCVLWNWSWMILWDPVFLTKKKANRKCNAAITREWHVAVGFHEKGKF